MGEINSERIIGEIVGHFNRLIGQLPVQNKLEPRSRKKSNFNDIKMVQNGLTGSGRSRKRHSMKSTYSKKTPRLEIQYLTTSHSLLKL